MILSIADEKVSGVNSVDVHDDPLAQWRIKYDADFVVRNIKLPRNLDEIPKIIGWSGPARSGTTALLYLLAGHPDVNRVYFQPQKTLMRQGGPPIVLNPKDELICMKEVFLSWEKVDSLDDPIDVLLKAGIPEEKITWIFMLRDPRQTFASWGMLQSYVQPDPAIYALWQAHTINLWRRYKDTKINAIPFVYEMLDGQEDAIVKRLLIKSGLNNSLKLEFNLALIDKKLIPGQAASEDYVPPLNQSHNRKKYVYSTNSYPLTPRIAKEVVALCQEEYEDFAKISESALGLHLI